jgi:hypothetical protein
MPTVPVTDGPRVAERPIADVRAPLETFGPGGAPVLSGTEEQVHALYQDERRKADQVAVLGAAGQVSQLENDLTTATRAKLGTNAFTAPEEVAASWNERVSKIGGTLTNDDQKLAFQNIVQSHWNSLNNVVQGHVATQRRVVDDDRTNSYMASEANAAVQNFMDPLRVAQAIQNQQAAIRDHAARNGLPPEWVDAHVDEVASKTHVAVIDRMLANDQDVAAKKYYDVVKDQIAGPEATQVDRALEIGSTRAESQKQAQTIMTSTTTRAEALEAVDKINDPKIQDATRVRVEKLWQQKDDNAREVSAARMQQATDIVRRTGDFNSVPPSMLVGMSVTQQDALLTFAKRLQEGVPVKTDLSTFGDLTKMFSNPTTRDAAMKLDLNRYVSRLSDVDYKHFSELQGGLIKGEPAAEKKLDGIFTNVQIVESGLRGAGLGAGLNPGAKKEDAATVNGLKQTINQQVEDLEQHTKRPATSKEVTDITNEVLTQHIVMTPGHFWDSTNKKRIDQMGPNDQLVVRSSDIPRADYRAITQQLRSQGMPLTDDNVVAAYKAYLMRLKPRGR